MTNTDIRQANKLKKNTRFNDNLNDSRLVERLIKGNLKRPRLSVYRSNQNLYAQIIDDRTSTTVVSCSTLDREIKLLVSNGRTCEASKLIGEKLAKLSLEKDIKQIVFDRGRYLYHGRIKALADGARSGGLQF